MKFEISIVVCTYNRAEILKENLNSLSTQNADKLSYEVIIVNNNSSDNTADVIDQYLKTNDNFRVVNELQQGLSFARNRGFKEASSPWIAYIDDDMILPFNFVSQVIQTIQSEKYDCFGGLYWPKLKGSRPRWVTDEFASKHSYFTNNLYREYASGGLMVIKKEILEAINGFDISLGMSGNKRKYGEETNLQIKISKMGYRIGFDAGITANHVVICDHLSVLKILRFRYVVGLSYWTTVSEKPTLLYLIILPLRASGMIFVRMGKSFIKFNKNYYIQNFLIDSLDEPSFLLGAFFSGINRYFN